ncbi:hypothetical protein LXL04_002433 [Taraxacum kok-saghyz]
MKTKTGSCSISFRFAICLIRFIYLPKSGSSTFKLAAKSEIREGIEKEQETYRRWSAGRRSIAALVRGALASPVMAAPAVALSFSPLVDLVLVWFLSQCVKLSGEAKKKEVKRTLREAIG